MYALDNVHIVSRTHTEVSDIPAHIQALYYRYKEIYIYQDSCRNTPAEKRTSTMRFNKLYAAIEAAGMNVPDVLVRMTNTEFDNGK